jgi:hypothetical protein
MTACNRAHALLYTLTVFATMLLPMQTLAQNDTAERAVIEIIEIEHRDPDRIRERVSAAVDPRGSVGLIDDKLVIATTVANLRLLRDIIADADSPPRRLIVGVDFAYRADAGDSNSQQQSQSIEGEPLVFVGRTADAALTGTDNAEPAPVTGSTPRITIAAEIVEDNAALVNISLANFTDLAGNHIVRVPLGTWQTIAPPVSASDASADTDAATDAVPDAAPDAATQPVAPAVAVRIDIVP